MTQDLDSIFLAIAEDLLDRSGRGIITGDFDLFAGCFHLPQHFETFNGPQCVENAGELRSLFDALSGYYHSIGVEDLVRRVVHLEPRDEASFDYVHESRLMRGTTLLQEPYPVYSTARLTTDGWKVVGASYAVSGSPRHVRALTFPRKDMPKPGTDGFNPNDN